MGEDDRRGVMRERGLHDFPRINAGLGQRAAEELVAGDDAVLSVKEDAHEYFVAAVVSLRSTRNDDCR